MFWPTINSYKRLVDGFWAPVKPTWGMDNRTASFRVIAGSAKSTRLETRCPGADVNPYLAMAAVIAAGLHGVEKGLKLTAPPITGTNQGAENIPRAPRSLIETTRNFQQLEDRARLVRRHLRRPLRGHPRLGMAPVAGRGDRLGIEALLRDHLKLSPIMTISGFSFPTAIQLRRRRAQGGGAASARAGPQAAADRHRQGAGRAARAGRVQDSPGRAGRGGVRRRLRQPDRQPGDGRGGRVQGAPRRLRDRLRRRRRARRGQGGRHRGHAPGRHARVRVGPSAGAAHQQRPAVLRRAAHHLGHRLRSRPLVGGQRGRHAPEAHGVQPQDAGQGWCSPIPS